MFCPWAAASCCLTRLLFLTRSWLAWAGRGGLSAGGSMRTNRGLQLNLSRFSQNIKTAKLQNSSSSVVSVPPVFIFALIIAKFSVSFTAHSGILERMCSLNHI